MEENKRPDRKKTPLEAALVKMADLCARSEQCAYDIARKLRLQGFSQDDTMRVIHELEGRKFLDPARFARSYAGDKMRFSGWGRVKIKAALLQRRIPESDIREALEALDGEVYLEKLLNAARIKARRLDLDDYGDRMKLMRHLVSRGYTGSEASKALNIIRQDEQEEEDEED